MGFWRGSRGGDKCFPGEGITSANALRHEGTGTLDTWQRMACGRSAGCKAGRALREEARRGSVGPGPGAPEEAALIFAM